MTTNAGVSVEAHRVYQALCAGCGTPVPPGPWHLCESCDFVGADVLAIATGALDKPWKHGNDEKQEKKGLGEMRPLEMKEGEGVAEHVEVHRISDVVPSISFEGSPARVEEIVGFDALVLDVAQFPSSYENQDHYIVAQLEIDGESLVLRTGALVIMKKLLAAKDAGALPVLMKVVQRKSRAGREYFDVE